MATAKVRVKIIFLERQPLLEMCAVGGLLGGALSQMFGGSPHCLSAVCLLYAR